MAKQTIVISAVNLVEGGGLSVLVDCLNSLASNTVVYKYRVIVLVNDKNRLPDLPSVEYVEIPKAKKSYLFRCYYEYFYFHLLSRRLKPYLWLSLHDMSPRVRTEVQAVYMHNPSPFFHPNRLTWEIAPQIALWAYLYKFVYRINIHSNKYLVVQQQWLRDEFSRMFAFSKNRIIVARPVIRNQTESFVTVPKRPEGHQYLFVYPSFPRVFKNFEVICEAVKILENEGVKDFKVKLTIDGSENKYSRFIVETYGKLESVEFIGLQPKSKMNRFYAESNCLIFPSKIETWGLPLSEYQSFHKPMLVADLPYAHESVEGADCVCFFDPNDATQLANEMKNAIAGNQTHFESVSKSKIVAPFADSWETLFNLLLEKNSECFIS